MEDDRLSMTLLSDFLSAHGYSVLKTSEGLEAIDLARDEQPDLILMDIRLPEISGFEVTRLLRQDNHRGHSNHCGNRVCDAGIRNQGFGEWMRRVYHKAGKGRRAAEDSRVVPDFLVSVVASLRTSRISVLSYWLSTAAIYAVDGQQQSPSRLERRKRPLQPTDCWNCQRRL